MKLESTKLLIVEKVLKTKNPKILSQILTLVESENEDFWNELSSYEQQLIEKSIILANEGKLVPYEKVMKNIGKN